MTLAQGPEVAVRDADHVAPGVLERGHAGAAAVLHLQLRWRAHLRRGEPKPFPLNHKPQLHHHSSLTSAARL